MVIADLVDTLSRIGAIGGILSIVGVGMLILLVASQNRQIRSMREWIEEEPQRQQEVAQRVIAEVQRRIAAARERRAAPAGAPVPPVGAARPLPAAPGTLGATPAAQKTAAKKEIVPAAAVDADPAAGSGAPAFAPLTPAGGADPADGSVPPPSPDPAEEPPAVVADFLSQETQVADALPDQEPLAAASGADIRFGDDQFDLHDEEPRGGSRVLFGVGVAALIAGIVIAGIILFGGGGGDDNAAKTDTPVATDDGGSTSKDDGTTKASTPATLDPASITVRVLNGTTVSGLAQRVTDTLKGKGYATDRPDTLTSNQTVQQTMVAYRAGKKSAAEAVAKSLGLTTSAVQEIDADLSVAAGPNAQVVVLTGTDLDSTSGTTGE